MIPDAERMARLTDEMTRPPLHHWLAPEAVTASEGRVEIRLPVRPEFCHSADRRFVHGGIVATLIDIAGHAVVAVEQGCQAPSVTLGIEFIRPAPATELQAVAMLRRLGRSLSRADIEIHAEGRLVALGRGTFANPGESR